MSDDATRAEELEAEQAERTRALFARPVRLHAVAWQSDYSPQAKARQISRVLRAARVFDSEGYERELITADWMVDQLWSADENTGFATPSLSLKVAHVLEEVAALSEILRTARRVAPEHPLACPSRDLEAVADMIHWAVEWTRDETKRLAGDWV